MTNFITGIKRIAAVLISVVLLISALPIYAFADEFEEAAAPQVAVEETQETVQEETSAVDTQEVASEAAEEKAEEVIDETKVDAAEEVTEEAEAVSEEDEIVEEEVSETAEMTEETENTEEVSMEAEAVETVEEEVSETAEMTEETENTEEVSKETEEVSEEVETVETAAEDVSEAVEMTEEETAEDLVFLTFDLGEGLELAGLFPKDAIVVSVPVSVEIEGEEVLASFDITIYENEEMKELGTAWQPEGDSITVRIKGDAFGSEELNVYHTPEGGEPEYKGTTTAVDGTVEFEADSFSVWTVSRVIVPGPSDIPTGWRKMTNTDEFLEKAESGIYIGQTAGYYLTNVTITEKNMIGIKKTKPAQSYPADEAALYFFESAGESKYYVYCMNGNEKQYVGSETLKDLYFTDEAGRTAFDLSVDTNGRFNLSYQGWFWNMQYGEGGNRFCPYNVAGDQNNNLYFWYYEEIEEETAGLDKKSFGLMNWNGGTAGKALMAEERDGKLSALALTVMTKAGNSEEKLFVPKDSDITDWTFRWIKDDTYYLTTKATGSLRYLKITGKGLYLADSPDENCILTVTAGTGIHKGQVSIKAGKNILTYSGKVDTGFTVNGAAGSEWLYLTAVSELTSEYFMTYSASKVSVSAEEVTNGSRIILYTRSWDEANSRYVFYAVDHDGSLVPVFESGDSIQWVGGRLNTLLWNLVEYYWEGSNEPNYFYELYNQYSQKYIAPQISKGQLLSGDVIGINLNGRRNGQYYSSILAWDETAYKYTGLKVENGKVVPCSFAEAEDFYFAVMQDISVDDELTTVPTVDHTQYGITMKMVDFKTRDEMSSFLGNNAGGAVYTTVDGLLSSDLKANGYPTAKGGSLARLFANAQEVNHLFIASTYSGSGYYEFDSTQNFASLQSDGNFRVYKEIGSYDASTSIHYQHGQFFPYNDIEAGKFTSVNRYNLYSATGVPYPDTDPRKREQLYLVPKPNFYFAVEIEASFTQTPDGLDAWGHDIVYEFTGDDDLWLYVDGELVLDLGGIHNALPGTINYSTGAVNVNGKATSLREIFHDNYIARGYSEKKATRMLSEIFEMNERGQWVFKEYTTHTMKIFFMERGAGASNLHMRFNLASVKPGSVLLSKELGGVENSDSVEAEFPYQVFYRVMTARGLVERQLVQEEGKNDVAVYKDSINPLKSSKSVVINGKEYKNVFLLKAGETAEISFPEDAVDYRMVECGVDTNIFSSVTVNGTRLTGEGRGNTKDFGLGYESIEKRARVTFVNHVDPEALRTVTITKRLFNEAGDKELRSDETRFSLRLYLGTGFGSEMMPANMKTYFVKDQAGNYCSWNEEAQRFESLGKRDYAKLTAAEKEAARFTTSMNGSVSKIPAFYTVELREVLAGTRVYAEERAYEIPDGYSLQKYVRFEDANEKGIDSEEPVAVTVNFGKDPHIDVCNLRGWGLRVNKLWSDAGYVEDREDVYFAVYTLENGEETLLDGSVRRLSGNEDTIYWYYRVLPKAGVAFENYIIREVKLSGNIEVSEDGTVSGYTSVTALADGEETSVAGRQSGDSIPAAIKYTVLYEAGELSADSNVRIDTVTNYRPGIVLRKTDMNGNAVEGAVFTLKDSKGSLVGRFTSAADGNISTAFLREGEIYTLEEIKVPTGYYGLERPAMICVNNGTVTVNGLKDSEYSLEQGLIPVLTLKNRGMNFRVIKVDADTKMPIEGVHFELHRQVTVDGVTTIDLEPMAGYEDLVTDANGMLPKMNGLAAGTYELRETKAQGRYENLSSYIRFTVSETGRISLEGWVMDVELEKEETEDSVDYTMVIGNHLMAPAPTGYTAAENMAAFAAMMGSGVVLSLFAVLKKLFGKKVC